MSEATTTVLGTAAFVAGELASDDDVTIHGTIEGPVSSGRMLRIGPNGDIRGDVSAVTFIRQWRKAVRSDTVFTSDARPGDALFAMTS